MSLASNPFIVLTSLVVTTISAATSTAITYQVIYNSEATWAEARAAAASMGGHLVTITSSAEQQAVEAAIAASHPPREGALWIGLRETTEGVYVWDNGESLSYMNWNPGEPNNLDGVEDRGHLMWSNTPSRNGKWNDVYHDGVPFPNFNNDITRMGYIVEVAQGPALGAVGTSLLLLSLMGLGSVLLLRRRSAVARHSV